MLNRVPVGGTLPNGELSGSALPGLWRLGQSAIGMRCTTFGRPSSLHVCD